MDTDGCVHAHALLGLSSRRECLALCGVLVVRVCKLAANWQCWVFNCLFSLLLLPLPLPLPFPSERTAEVPQCYAAGGTCTTSTIPWGNPQYWIIELTLSLLKSEQTRLTRHDIKTLLTTGREHVFNHPHTSTLHVSLYVACYCAGQMMLANSIDFQSLVHSQYIMSSVGWASCRCRAQQPVHTDRQADRQMDGGADRMYLMTASC